MQEPRIVNVRMRRVCLELIRMRQQMKLSGKEAAFKLGVHPSTISRLENGQRTIDRDDVSALLGIYKAPRPLRKALLTLYDRANEPGLVTDGALKLHDDLADWIGFEQTAAGIRNYQPFLVPGLLQTFHYAREVIAGFGVPLSDAEVEARANARVARQALLRKRNSPGYSVILHEAALHQDVGGPDVMRPQLHYLLEAAQKPHIDIRVIPMKAGVHAGLDSGPFVILDYYGLSSLIHLENKVSSLYLDSDAAVSAYKLSYAGLVKKAHSVEDSLSLIRATITSLT